MRALVRALGVAAVLGGLLPLHAATMEVKGKVTDAQGEPIEGATVTLQNKTVADSTYVNTTDKRGSYRLPPVLYSEQARMWLVKVEAPGRVASHIRIESRKSDRTLVGDIVDRKLSPQAGPQELMMVAFGKIQIDFEMQSGDAVAASVVTGSPDGGMPAGAVSAPATDPFAQAAAKAAAGDLEGALPLLEAAIAAHPNDPERLEYHARVLYKLDRPDEALRQAARSAGLAPERLESKLLMAGIQNAQGKSQDAWTALEGARALAPQDKRVLELTVQVAGQLGKTDESIAAHEALVALQPDRAESWMALGSLYASKGQGQKSQQAFEKVTALDPRGAYRTFYNIGVVIESKSDLSQEDTERAIDAYRKSIEVKPDYALAHQRLGYALLRANDVQGARAELERYLELQPKASDAAQIRAMLKDLP